ncbi:type III PLP-dependent enzyme [Amphiplicatus metriothermophilus]|uniref:ornithine decarboxylase n=1 Tax=Amphiplicatus metriothermophilus TaxID=1519374 RepID=A0A239PW59_9PROT|nr:type III PLP-dependent enzyme [Amphiplicatus metriothermophilus]MBB5519701.1 ornithine decarboxylase [Amphiplicatus metriothermophilus]SNT74263.1 ornithine decarboxylase [Amphiplicatus metriothermophilus]
MERSKSALALVLESRPDLPVHCLRPHAAEAAARWFLRHFPGDVLYAVKANPHPAILDAVHAAGVRWFDVASMPEVALIAGRFPDARLAFMHPVKARSAIRRAYFDYGVRVFALDSMDELAKIVAETGGAKDLHLVIRIAVSGDYAQHKLSGKFGAAGAEAVTLLREARAHAAELGVSFHVGSQCMRPEAWRVAMQATGELIRHAGVTVDIVDVGGGFPAAYPGLTPPPLDQYIAEIRDAFETMPVLENADLWCEPGRALCAEAGSHIVRVEARKDDALYLNDGGYGALFDAAHDGLVFPARLLRAKGGPRRPLKAFRLYGPTCDSIDAMPGPFFLPADVHEGDYIEFGLTGAYGATLATRFNGFGEYEEAIVADAPLTSMYGLSGRRQTQGNVVAMARRSGGKA